MCGGEATECLLGNYGERVEERGGEGETGCLAEAAMVVGGGKTIC